MFDYSSGDRAKLSQIFIPSVEDTVPQVRFDFSLRRSLAMAVTDGNPGHGFIAGLGALSASQTMHVNRGHAGSVQFRNDGTARGFGNGSSAWQEFEDFDTLGVNNVAIFYNADDQPFVYDAPDGEVRTLAPFSHTSFINNTLLDENRGFFVDNNELRHLGKLAFITGQGSSSTYIDFVVDNVRIAQFFEAGSDTLPRLLISYGLDMSSALLSWESIPEVGYQLEHSSDLQIWAPIGDIFIGTGQVMEYPLSTDNSERGFYRLSREN
jgi:hypothetical protein